MTDRRARILEVTSYPPPRAGWGIRVEFLKRHLEAAGHECVVLNTGTSRRVPSTEYLTVMSGFDLVRKVWRHARQGFLVHAHANGDSVKGAILALGVMLIGLAGGRRPVLTFHAGVIQRHFPPERGRHLMPFFWLLFAVPGRIICNSQAVKDAISRYGVPSRKVVPIAAFCREYLAYSTRELPSHVEEFFGCRHPVLFAYVRMRALFYPLTLVDAMAQAVRRRPDLGLVLCGGLSHGEDSLWAAVQARVRAKRLEDHICFVDDLDHDSFLTALKRSAAYVRTPITDGVASSVLEALALGVPVVGCENGTRPKGVLTYPAEDADALAAAIHIALSQDIDPTEISVDIPDTLSDEAGLLTS